VPTLNIIGIGSGGIAGYGIDDTIIKSCHSTGIIKGNRSGGIVGAFAGSIEIRNCYTTGSVVGGEKQLNGAICGSHTAKNNIRIFNCYACGNVENGGYFNPAKLEPSQLKDCYSEVQNGNTPIWNVVNAENILQDGVHKHLKTYDIVAGNKCFIGLSENANNKYVLFGRPEFTINSSTGVISTDVKTQGDTYKLLIVNLEENRKIFEEIQINIEPFVEAPVVQAPLPKSFEPTSVGQVPVGQVPVVQASLPAPVPAPVPKSFKPTPVTKAPVAQTPVPKAPLHNPFSMSFMRYNNSSTYIPVGVSVLPEGKPVNPMGAQNLQAKVYRT